MHAFVYCWREFFALLVSPVPVLMNCRPRKPQENQRAVHDWKNAMRQ